MEREKLRAAGVTPSRIMMMVAGAAFTSPADVMSWGPDGLHVTPSNEISPAAMAAIKKVSMTQTFTKRGDVVQTTTVELHDKIRALDLLAKLTKMFDDDADSKKTASVFVIGDQRIEF
jgi:hypothetical protein